MEKENYKSIHENAVVFDAHNDTVLRLIEEGPFVTPTRGELNVMGRKKEILKPPATLAKCSGESRIDLPRAIEGGVNCLVFSCFVSPDYADPLRRLIQYLDVLLGEIEGTEGISLAKSYRDIEGALENSEIAALISIEGGSPLKESVEVLRTLNRLGVTSLILTHFRRNALGDGSGADYGSGLTDFGREVILEMNDLGMVVDLAHINRNGFFDALEASKDPVIVSHANVYGLVEFHRNLTDEQIRNLADKGGVLGLSFVSDFIQERSDDEDEKATVGDLIDHVDYLKDLVGTDHIGIGSDFDGGGGLADLPDTSKLPRFTRGLIDRGYSTSEVEGILGRNTLRVYREVLPAN